jgi:hypothetical protein
MCFASFVTGHVLAIDGYGARREKDALGIGAYGSGCSPSLRQKFDVCFREIAKLISTAEMRRKADTW